MSERALPAAGVLRRSLTWPRLDRGHLLAGLILLAFAWLYLRNLAGWRIDGDEEGYLYAAWRITLGELPYRDFLTPQLPGFLFPGALVLRLFGNDAWAPRAWSVLLVLLTGGATYLTGRRLFGAVAGLAAMTIFLASDDVFEIGRRFRPEATMLACGALALYVFVRADAAGRRGGIVLASLLFGAGLLAKLFGLLPWAATIAYLVAAGLLGWRPRRALVGDLAALALPGALLVAGVMGAFRALTPETYVAVLGHHLMQGADQSWQAVLRKNLSFYWRTLNWHTPILVWLPLAVAATRRLAPRRGWVVLWQIPTLLAFLFLSRTLFARHLVYLLPALGLTLGIGLEWIHRQLGREPRMAALVAATIIAMAALPNALDNLGGTALREIGTERAALLIRSLLPEDERILADSPGLGFYAGRGSTYTAAGLSEGATESGQISGRQLLAEAAAGGVGLVLMDQSPQATHLTNLLDFADFRDAIEAGYTELGTFYRFEQPHRVFARPESKRLALDFGFAELIALDRPARVASGGGADLGLVLRVAEPADRPYTAFLHLVGPDGATWGQGDGLLDNALLRSSEEWRAGEIVAAPLRLQVEPGTPPGRYRLRLGLYDPATGTRVPWTEPGQGSGEAWDAGEIEVTAAESGAGGDAAALRAAFPPEAWLDRPLGPLRILAARFPGSAEAGGTLPIRLTWRQEEGWDDDGMFVRLVLEGGEGRVLGETSLSLDSVQSSPSGTKASQAQLAVDPDAPEGRSTLRAEWGPGGAGGETIDLGELQLHALPPPQTEAPALPRPLDARFGPSIALLGSDLPETAAAGATLPFTLSWRADAPPEEDYTVLVHLVRVEEPAAAGSSDAQDPIQAGASGTAADPSPSLDLGIQSIPTDPAAILAQADGAPAGGRRPTRGWRPGEVIADARQLRLPEGLPAGSYAVLVGLYDATDPAYPRLAARSAGRPLADGRVPIGLLRLP